MDPQRSLQTPQENGISNTAGVERAPKRRRLNNEVVARQSAGDSHSEPTARTSTAASNGGWPVSDEFVRLLDYGASSSPNHQSRPFSSFPSHTGIANVTLSQSATSAPEDRDSGHGRPRDRDPDVGSLARPAALATASGSDFTLPGDRNLPFGLLYNARSHSDDRERNANGSLSETSGPPQPALDAMDAMDAIDLTAVNDGPGLRRREEIDDESRRLRREASMKLEARRKANAQMLKSTLEEQQANSAKAERSARIQGMEGMQCVICMDNFTDMTATHCGHLFCHTCINEHLITAEMSRAYPITKVRASNFIDLGIQLTIADVGTLSFLQDTSVSKGWDQERKGERRYTTFVQVQIERWSAKGQGQAARRGNAGLSFGTLTKTPSPSMTSQHNLHCKRIPRSFAQ